MPGENATLFKEVSKKLAPKNKNTIPSIQSIFTKGGIHNKDNEISKRECDKERNRRYF